MGGPDPDRLSFQTAAGLFEALDTRDAVARRNVLGWVATHPAEAIALGPHEGRDVLDHLIGLIDRGLDYPYWEDIAIAIGTFDAPRATAFFLDLLATAEESAQAYDAASALEHRIADPTVVPEVSRILRADGPPERLGAAAQLLAGREEAPEDLAARIAAIDPEAPAPGIDRGNREAWLRELSGEYADGARERLEEQGPPAMRELVPAWDSLGRPEREWLLDWVSDAAPGEPVAAAAVSRALEPGSEVAPAGLRAAALLPDCSVPRQALARWVADERPETRALAIAAGAPADLAALASGADTSPQELCSALPRLGVSGAPGAAGLIAPHLGSDLLEVRAAARGALVDVGPAAVPALRPLVHDEREETRAAAVRALLDLGDDEWLAAELL